MGMDWEAPPVQNHPAEQLPLGALKPSPWQNSPGGHISHDVMFDCWGSGLYVPSGQGYSVAYDVPDNSKNNNMLY